MSIDGYSDFLNSDIRILKGIGEKKAILFNKLGIATVENLLYAFPCRYEDRTVKVKIADAKEGDVCCIDAVIFGSIIEKKIKKNMSLYILRAEDETGHISVKWFSSPFNKNRLKKGQRVSFYGTIEGGQTYKEMLLKDMEPWGENNLTGRILPVYSLTKGLTQKDFRTAVVDALEKASGNIPETLNFKVSKAYKLIPLENAIRHMHMPASNADYETARYRLAFEELLVLCLALQRMRNIACNVNGLAVRDVKCITEFASGLPFELTDDQKKAVNDICKDFLSGKPMNRLVQGDVGSGKTVVAACASYVVCKSGYQTVLMAPTEILAIQHYNTFKSFFKNTNLKIALLTSSVKDKKSLLQGISHGEYDIVVGTHALLETRTEFNNLGLCITDEQHRFGVQQRADLSKDKAHPHVLVMSATPIPRTLSLVLYGDLDISVISSLPSGRQKVETYCISNALRSRLDGFIQKQIDEGSQCFVVCPLIEESEKVNASSASEIFEYMCQKFGRESVGYLHGKLSSDDKDEVMNRFIGKEILILVSTTVIEVGIDVPNATLMIIENAERFGLSQLHQLRGRVGRGKKKSYCVLVSEKATQNAKDRIDAMCKWSDGFKIAEEDLRMRGYGEFFGTRQHGVPELKIANLFTDLPVAHHARAVCDEILKSDPGLCGVEFRGVKRKVLNIFDSESGIKIFN